jgi:O-antigen/teichoic acid export membrane protein
LSIRKSLVYSYLDRYASLVVSIVSSMVIARVLTPEDIGVFSVTMVLISFVATVRDLGAGQYLIQEKELTTDRIRAVWAVQLGLGVILALVVLAASVPVARFYQEPRMLHIMLVVAANYVINPFGSLTYAWQMREMRFDTLAIVRFTATLVGAVVGVAMAWWGHGPISLAYGALASTVVNAGMAIFYRPKDFPWLPGTKEIRRVLAFGSRLTGSSILQTVAGSAPELLLGKLQSMTAVGLFSRATGLVSMFNRIVLEGMNVVAISWFAKQTRQNESITPAFLTATSYAMALGWAFCLGLVFLAHPTIHMMYGDQWGGAVDLTRVVAVSLAVSLPSALCHPALMALGSVDRMLRVTTYTTVLTVVLVAIGSYFGLMAMGWCVVLAAALRSWVWLVATRKEVDFTWSALLSLSLGSAAVASASAIGPLCAFVVYGPYPTEIWQPLVMGVPTALAGFLVAVIGLKHPLLDEIKPLWVKLRSLR